VESEKQERQETQKNNDFQDEQGNACCYFALARQRPKQPEHAKPQQKKIHSHEETAKEKRFELDKSALAQSQGGRKKQ